MAKATDNPHIKATVDTLLEQMKNPDSLEMVSKSMFRRNSEIPSDNWSLLNRMIMAINDTNDARTFNSWKKIERMVKKGSKAFYILKPKIIKESYSPKQFDTDGNEVKVIKCVGFLPQPEFRYEDTDGEPVDYSADREMPEFLGKEVAEKWNLTVSQDFANPSYYAYYSPIKEQINMATDDQQTFFHELCHASDDRILKSQGKALALGQDPVQEIVADFASCVLMHMVGLKASSASTYSYVKRYAVQLNKDVVDSVIPLVNRIGKVVDLIVKEMDAIREEQGELVEA